MTLHVNWVVCECVYVWKRVQEEGRVGSISGRNKCMCISLNRRESMPHLSQ